MMLVLSHAWLNTPVLLCSGANVGFRCSQSEPQLIVDNFPPFHTEAQHHDCSHLCTSRKDKIMIFRISRAECVTLIAFSCKRPGRNGSSDSASRPSESVNSEFKHSQSCKKHTNKSGNCNVNLLSFHIANLLLTEVTAP